jgi:hypothetical protein
MRRMVSVTLRIGPTRTNRRRLISQLGEKRRRPCAVWKRFQRAQRVFGATREPSHHLVWIHPNAFELRDELSNYFNVRHPAPDWRGRPRLLRPQSMRR